MAERTQTKKLGVVRRTPRPMPAPSNQLFTKAEAHQHTDRILSNAEETFRLVKEAYDRQIWVTLDYANWEEYLKKDLDLSQREGFRLLAQGRVVYELENETGVTLPVRTVSVTDAQVLQKQPEERRRIIRRAQKAPEEDRPGVIRTAVRSVRDRSKTSTDGRVTARNDSKKRAPGGPLPADVTDAMTTVSKRLHSFINQGLPQKMGLAKAKRFYDKVLDPLLADIDRWREQVQMLENREASATQ